MRAVQIAISGRVQGVGYRAWLEARAAAAGLDGWVRNRRDGTVEAVLCGDDTAVATLLPALHHGPAHATVTAVAVTAHTGPVAHGFAVLPTL